MLSLKSENKKERIMAAVIELVAENGIHATPMSKVCKRANAAAGTVYHHFDSKEQIVRETYLALKNHYVDLMRQNDDESLDYQSRFLRFWHTYYQFLLTVPKQLSFIEQCAISPVIDDETWAKIHEHAKPIEAFFEQGVQEKHIKAMPVELLYSLIYGSIVGTAKLKINQQIELTEEQVEQAALFCWNGLRK